MLRIEIDKGKRRLKLLTDDSSVRYLLESVKEETKYIPWKKSWGTLKTVNRIYDEKRVSPDAYGIYTFTLGYGWAGYLINVFKGYLSPDNYNRIIQEVILSPTFRTLPFPELRDYQNEDVLHILKYRVGLVCVNTSYGKTQTICVLANYFAGFGKRVIIITPGSKPRDEVIKRYKLLYGETIPNSDLSVNCMITTGLLNRKDIKDPDKLKDFEQLMASYDVCLVDEAEYTMNDSGEFLYDRLVNLSNAYSFSATSDKTGAEMISFVDGGLTDVVIRNKMLVKYFGPSLVYRMPLNIKIDNITVKTSKLDSIKFDKTEFDKNGNVYLNVMNKIWTDPGVCNLLVRLVERFPKLFIPINNLNKILNEWINNYFKGRFKILLICGDDGKGGYIYYGLDGVETKIDLVKSCELINRNEVDVILGTSSSYRALDLPNLESIFVPTSNIAGVVLQCIGRVARGTHMNIISLDSISGKKIPIYTKGAQGRDELMKTYYKYCEIVDSVIYENNL